MIIAGCLLAGVALFFAAQLVMHTPASIQVTVSGGPAAVGSPAPDFSSQTLDGKRVQLSGFRGKPVLINFWATWCTPCQVEMPEIQRAFERYGSQGLTVLAVNYQQTDATAMHDFLKKLAVRFPAVYDPDGRIATAYGVTIGLPVSVFVDRSGRVSFIQLGQMSNTFLDDKVHSIL